MRLTRIHTPQPLRSNSDIVLEPQASRHLSRALRLNIGDELIVFNTENGSFAATITGIDKKAVTVRIGQGIDDRTESPLNIHLGIALSRGDRFDWVVQKATELGVQTLSPLVTERTGVKLTGERAQKKQQHWQQIAISACEQCGRHQVPELRPITKLQDWLDNTAAQRKFVLHHRATPNASMEETVTSVALLIGPEGGLSETEIDAAENAAFIALQLGPRVLRTETAPLAALTLLQSRWGDLPQL